MDEADKMGVYQAFEKTMELAEERGYPGISFDNPLVEHEHLIEMMHEVAEINDEWKANRWLGFAQGVLVANDMATVEELKRINKEWL